MYSPFQLMIVLMILKSFGNCKFTFILPDGWSTLILHCLGEQYNWLVSSANCKEGCWQQFEYPFTQYLASFAQEFESRLLTLKSLNRYCQFSLRVFQNLRMPTQQSMMIWGKQLMCRMFLKCGYLFLLRYLSIFSLGVRIEGRCL